MLHQLSATNIVWLTLGFIGQGLFGVRIIIQWLYSEKHRKSVIPMAFWWFSVTGGICMLIYAIHIKDPVFIISQALGLLVYMRNIYLIHHERKPKAQPLSAIQ
jgi:lipid-A-disaccharide synthase-like uncharacterized protein